ncbi:DUF5336 domain-containing protein [Yinghuangia soli]|uniref:DUF5336 domain-containing protein n=1 Tax=Yinghuangia soli TaxID=2908204 RepID=A0AA41U5N3_9ACTN|nr:DUF5336 domain-containing protein [Yinghuangia soli]MCF2532112.1 DUF5336 domain-containing protein [Yinghuangia soli]
MPPHEPPPPPPEAFRKSEPPFDLASDWPAMAAIVCGAVAIGMMFLDWPTAKVLRRESGDSGFDRSLMPAAPIILVILLVAVVAVAGYSMLAKKHWLLLLAAVPAFAALMVVIVMMTTLSKIGDDILESIPGGSFSLGAGAWLCLVFTILALAASLVPGLDLLKRPAPAAPPAEFPHADGD